MLGSSLLDISQYSARVPHKGAGEIFTAEATAAQVRFNPSSEPTQHWFAAYVIRNHEKRVNEQLQRKGIEVFLPLHSVVKRWKNNTSPKQELPLFPCYLFTRIAPEERRRVLEVASVVSIVGNAQGPVPLPDAEVEALRTGLQMRQVDPHPYLKVGVRARICSGSLQGMEGIIVRKDDRLRIVLSLDLIMRSISVHVEADELEICA